VARRTGEIGIRMALGARQSDVEWQVIRETMSLVGAGALVGVFAALAASRAAITLLYGVSATDPVSIAGALAVLGTAALFAGWIPARRASRVDPMTALRHE
jgi:macrolide transport system ATP-binding/permease protein